MRLLTRVLLALPLFILLALALPRPGDAQSTDNSSKTVTIDRKKLLVQPRNADGTTHEVAFLDDPVLWARERQQAFYGQMSGTLRRMKTDDAPLAAWTLMLLSFGYGVFHAAGPGHGKAVISAWLLATESQLRRGVLIAFMSAIIQALTAITVVSVLFLVVASAGAAARDVAVVLESASYALIALLGLYLVFTALRALLPAPSAMPALAGGHAAQPLRLEGLESFQPFVAPAAPTAAGQVHVHGPDCGCGHAHLPGAAEVSGEVSTAKALSLAFAVGIRPCTGALLVLVFANGLGLYWAGVASTFAMAAGTFITVSAIAAGAVYARHLAARLASRDGRWLAWLSVALRFGGGAAIALLGTILFLGSLGGTGATM